MYQSNPELTKLQQEQASVKQQLKQLQHKQQRLENRKSYYEKAERKKRTHRLCTIAGTMESIAPEIKELTLPEVTDLLESIMDLPDVRRVIYNAVLLPREKKDGRLWAFPNCQEAERGKGGLSYRPLGEDGKKRSCQDPGRSL